MSTDPTDLEKMRLAYWDNDDVVFVLVRLAEAHVAVERLRGRAETAEAALAVWKQARENAVDEAWRRTVELAAAEARLERVRQLAESKQMTGEDGLPCDSDTLMPSDVLSALGAAAIPVGADTEEQHG